jgi:hypothetical protein
MVFEERDIGITGIVADGFYDRGLSCLVEGCGWMKFPALVAEVNVVY